MTKTVKENPQGKPGQASTANEVLKKVEVAHQTFMNEFGWLDWLYEPVQYAYNYYSDVIHDLDEISERLKKNQKMSKRKSTGIGLSPKMVAKLDKTADRVVALAALFEKRNHDAGRICIFLQEELPGESYLEHIKSIKRALKR